MNNSSVNDSSDYLSEQTESAKPQNVINSPLLASICAGICVFSSIIAFFFAGWFPLSFDPQITCWMAYVISDHSVFVNDAVFLILFILSIACYAGYLFIGSLNKWLGIIPLLIAGFCGLLYLITMLPAITGVYFLPFIFTRDFFGNVSMDDIPYYIWFSLTMIIMPIIYLIGTIQAKTIPIWKTIVLFVAPFCFFVFLFISVLLIGTSPSGYSFVISHGMAFWILFAIIIFSELIRTKVKKIYIWLTVILSGIAIVSSLLVIFTMWFWLNQKSTQYKDANLANGKDVRCRSYSK